MSGGLLSLANPPADLGPVAFVALLPLLWACRGARPRRGALLGFVFGLVYYGILVSWLLTFGVIAWLPLVASQAAYAALFGTLLPMLWRQDRVLRTALLAAGLWTAIDWWRGVWPVGGFTWGGLGYTQHANGFLLPLASVTGVWGLTFVVVLVNAVVVILAARLLPLLGSGSGGGQVRGALRPIAALVGASVAAVLVPALVPIPAANGASLRVAVVQGNVPLALAGDRLLQTAAVGENHIRLNRTLASNPPDLVVWPENALDTDPTVDGALGEAVSDSIRAVGAPTLVGAIRDAPGGRFYNQVLLYSGRGVAIGRYVKVHLVPFGEYVPFPSIFGWTERYRLGNVDLVPGSRRVLFHVDGQAVAAPICFENTFPNLVREFVADGATVVVVSTNDSSFRFSVASREHVIMSQVRAVENARWIVQAAISGESAIVDPRGRVVSHTALFTQAILRATVPGSTARTIYTRFGDWFPWACGLVVLAMLAAQWSRRRRRGSEERPFDATAPPAGERSGASRTAPVPIRGGADPRVLVVLPTYNERETLAQVLTKVTRAGPSIDALVIDDNSPDGTGEVAAALSEQEPGIRLIRRGGKLGLASAYLLGFGRGLDDGYDVIVEMDSDLSHRPEDLPALIAATADYDLVIGSRYVPGGGVTNWSRGRLALSKAGNAYARKMLGLPLTDATSGFRAYRRRVIEALLQEGVHSEGYAFQIELAYRAWRKGFRVGEVPIQFREREHGRSKLSRRIVVEALLKVGEWGVRDRFSRDGRL